MATRTSGKDGTMKRTGFPRARDRRRAQAATGDAEAKARRELDLVAARYEHGERKEEKLRVKKKADAGDAEAIVWMKARGMYRRFWRSWDLTLKHVKPQRGDHDSAGAVRIDTRGAITISHTEDDEEDVGLEHKASGEVMVKQ